MSLMFIQLRRCTSNKSSTTRTSQGEVIAEVGSWNAKGDTGPISRAVVSVEEARSREDGDKRGLFAGDCDDDRGDKGRGGCEFNASVGRGACARSNSPSKLPSGRSCRLSRCSEAVGELAVEMDMALEESESDSSLILVLSGSRTWCCGTVFLMLMLPVDFENGDSSTGVEAPSLVMDDGESNENDCERMRTFGLGVRGGAARRAAMTAEGAN